MDWHTIKLNLEVKDEMSRQNGKLNSLSQKKTFSFEGKT